ncbi:MAG: AraC family transcriptional regulator [Flavobacteriaceae bacterium]
MISPKPEFEKISPVFGSSLFIEQHKGDKETGVPFWHFHPELELVYINKARGKRHIGNHLSYFNNSQLILMGANLPHSGFADGFTSDGLETFVQFKEEFLGEHFFNIPEAAKIKFMFEKAKSGILFGRSTKDKVGPKIEKLYALEGFARIASFIDILNDLSMSNDYTLLNVNGYTFEVKSQENDKTKQVYKYIRKNFQETITLEEVSSLVSMTIPAFCRFFKKNTGKTFTQFVNEFRIVHATKLLAESTDSITDICHESGFHNFSHFNKLFKNYTGKSPLKYRNEMKSLILNR